MLVEKTTGYKMFSKFKIKETHKLFFTFKLRSYLSGVELNRIENETNRLVGVILGFIQNLCYNLQNSINPLLVIKIYGSG